MARIHPSLHPHGMDLHYGTPPHPPGFMYFTLRCNTFTIRGRVQGACSGKIEGVKKKGKKKKKSAEWGSGIRIGGDRRVKKKKREGKSEYVVGREGRREGR